MAAVMKASKKDAYIGERNNQIREGYGVYTYENKFFRYEGEWKAGKKHGHGKLVMADGSYYEGEFKSGEIEGHGYRYYAGTGNTYSGEFSQGELTGQGVMKYKDGSVYEGTWSRNKRSGYGVFKKENSIYQGYTYNNKRHGEGTQIYSTGDRYDGDWVNDMRQGHGKFKSSDGTQYNGQFRNDTFNGQGTIEHSSGMLYEGMWINGKPVNMASKLVIKHEQQIEITQGMHFEIHVECQNEMGTPTQDQRRLLKISAGYKNVLPEKINPKSAKKSDLRSALFDVIEDVEETVIDTPFGYQILSYPISDQMPDREEMGPPPEPVLPGNSSLSRQPTALTTENTMVEGGSKTAEGESKPTEESEATASTEAKPAEALTTDPTQLSQEPSNLGETVAVAVETEPEPEVPVYPAPEAKRTKNGVLVFTDLMMAGAPPAFRPFLVLDEQEKIEKNKQYAKAGKKVPKVSPAEEHKTRVKKFGDERFARPGTYVLIVEDVTDPPFMGIILDPAFVEVNVVLPKKVKKEKPKKEKLPKWDSARFIAGEKAREYSNIAIQDEKTLNSITAGKYSHQSDAKQSDSSEEEYNLAALDAIKLVEADPGGPLKKSSSLLSIKSSYSEN